MNISELYNLFKTTTGVSTDSRNIKKGSLFFALKGSNFDGNLFAGRALKEGCEFAVIDNESYQENDRFILVEDSLETLQNLARYHRSQLTIPVIAITGSNGKTTTKELLKAALSMNFHVAATRGNLNNHIGVPLTLLEITSEHELALIELGDNHLGEVAFLCQISKPNFGFVTNVGKDHLEGFGSMESNIKAKKEIFDYLAETNGTAFINENDELVESMSLVCERRELFGKGKKEPRLFSASTWVAKPEVHAEVRVTS
jgi:UDP-N-acetylmuramoyl-tripeptide--D-alanyl-D-alanine ligase